MYAERGMQAEYEAFSAITALVPPEVAEAIPPQLRQLAPRPQAQSDVIDVEPLVTPTQPSATLAAANSPETLLANQLGEGHSLAAQIGRQRHGRLQKLCLASIEAL